MIHDQCGMMTQVSRYTTSRHLLVFKEIQLVLWHLSRKLWRKTEFRSLKVAEVVRLQVIKGCCCFKSDCVNELKIDQTLLPAK